MPYNKIVADSFHTKKLFSRISSIEVLYTAVLRFGAPFRAVRNNVQCPSWAHWKARSGLPISVN